MLNTYLMYYLKIKFLDLYPREIRTHVLTKTSVQMFIAVLFAKGQIWKRLKGPSASGGINKLWYVYAIDY